VNLDALLNLGDQTKIRVVAGDLPEGNWYLDGSRLKRSQVTGVTVSETIDLAQNIKLLDLRNYLAKDSTEPLMGAGIGALLGLRFFGLLGAAGGAIAGHFLTQKGPEVSISCELKDGRKFLAVVHPKMYDRLRSIGSPFGSLR